MVKHARIKRQNRNLNIILSLSNHAANALHNGSNAPNRSQIASEKNSGGEADIFREEPINAPKSHPACATHSKKEGWTKHAFHPRPVWKGGHNPL